MKPVEAQSDNTFVDNNHKDDKPHDSKRKTLTMISTLNVHKMTCYNVAMDTKDQVRIGNVLIVTSPAVVPSNISRIYVWPIKFVTVALTWISTILAFVIAVERMRKYLQGRQP